MATKNAPRTVKDVPAQEFVVALAQYFRSTGKVRR
jgi:small subunit ribosomal protein S19e